MKRADMVEKISQLLMRYDIAGDMSNRSYDECADHLLKELESVGMKPPTIKILTPLGPYSFFTTNEWEENAKYDESGYPLPEEE